MSRTVGSGHEHGSRLSGRSTGEGLSLLLCDSVSSREKMRVRLSAGAVRMRAAGVWGGRGRGQAGRRGLRVAWLGRPQLPGSLGGQRAARLPLVSPAGLSGGFLGRSSQRALAIPLRFLLLRPREDAPPWILGCGAGPETAHLSRASWDCVSRSRFPVSNGRSVAPGLAGRGGTWSPTSCDRKSRKEGVSPRRLRPGHRAPWGVGRGGRGDSVFLGEERAFARACGSACRCVPARREGST